MSDNQGAGRTKGRGGPGGRKGGRGKGRGRGGKPEGVGNKPPAQQLQQQQQQQQGNKGGRSEIKGGRGGKSRRGGGGKVKASVMTEEEKLTLEAETRAAEEVVALEAERKRLEAEQIAIRQAREAKLQQQVTLCARVRHAIDSLVATSNIVQTHKKHRSELAPENLAKLRKEFEASKKNLKSDLKKCTAFVKKIKAGNAWSTKPADMERDVASLNLSRYVEEVAAALRDANFKVVDLPTVVALCFAMHCRYSEFLPSLMPSIWQVMNGKASDTEMPKSRRIVYVRLMTEFLLNGILGEHKQLLKFISEATGAQNGYAVADATVVVSFVKAAGFEVLGTKPRSIDADIQLLEQQVNLLDDFVHKGKSLQVPEDAAPEDIPQVISISLAEESKAALSRIQDALLERAVQPTVSEAFETYCSGAFETLCKSWVDTHTQLLKMEKRCEQDRLLQGNLPEAREKGLTDARKLNENLQKSVEAMAEILSKPTPALDEDEEEEDAGEGGPGLELWTKEGDEANDFGPFDDEETRSFYCDIPDLLTTIPPQLLGMSTEEILRLQAENLRKYGDGSHAVADDIVAAEVEPITEAELDDEEEDQEAQEDENKDINENKDSPHYKLQMLIEHELPECNRREQVDELSEKFCVNHGSSKNSRKRLTKALFQVPRTRLDLLPHYSRIAAIMDRIYPEISNVLSNDLEQQFHGQAKFKKQQNPEGRLKTARYLSELTKFRVAPPIVALRCLRRCLEDFSGFNIDVACCILESCGRFLYRTKHTVTKLTELMDTMMRLSKAKNLDERYHALINSAFFMVKPPPAAPRKQAKIYPPLEAYLRHLLLVRLEPKESSISFVTKQILKFPWHDPSQQCGALVCKYMLKACRKGRYKVVSAIASVAASIRRNKPEVAARVIDACFEEIRWALEHPSFRDQQRTITYARLLGELHAASLITGPIIIQELYNFINFGHEIPGALKEASAKQINEAIEEKNDKLPVYNSAGGVSVAIQEDEEMDDAELETKEEPEVQKVIAVSQHSVYDPRVPSVIDPPSSVFRVKLVCTLLEVSIKNLLTRNNLSNLDGFITAFQRYLYTKPTLPTEVEFALLDTFDALDSHWKKTISKDQKKVEPVTSGHVEHHGFLRYESWIDAHNATIAKEEEFAEAERRIRARLEALAGIGNLDILSDDENLAIEDGEADDDEYYASDVEETDSEDEMEDDDEGLTIRSMEEDAESGEEEEEEDGEDSDLETDDDDDDDYDDDEEFDEDAHMKQLEEEAFERELRRVTMEALEKGKNTARATSHGIADNMPSGSQFIRKKQAEAIGSEAEGPAVALGGEEGISFQLLRKGNKGKVEAKQIVVPKDTALATRALKYDGAADREHDIIKARVLQYEAESAEQEHGNVYLEQSKLQVIRNRPLSMEVIDRNFGTSRGDRPGETARGRGSLGTSGRISAPNSGRGPGRGRGRGRGGRTLKNF